MAAAATSSTWDTESSRRRAWRISSCSSKRSTRGCRRMSADAGILCMAYGSPATEADIAAYFTHIRGGRPPSPEALAELTARYRAIGGSPLTEITRAQASALSIRAGLPAFVGMKHASPFIADGAAEARRQGIRQLVGLPLAPHYARMSLGSYQRPLQDAWEGELVFVAGFHDHPAFIGAVQGLLRDAVGASRPDRLFFTAHSLPARIIGEGDPYRDQLLESCRLVASGMQLPKWEFAFQSASHTGEPWLGPDLLEAGGQAGANDGLGVAIRLLAHHIPHPFDLHCEAPAR